MNRGVVLLIALLFFQACAVRTTILFPRGGRYHTVRPGDTLYRISQIYRVDVESIAAANRLRDPSKIVVGQRLYIPLEGTRVRKPAPASTPSTHRKKSPAPTAPKNTDPTPKVSPNIHLTWPLKGTVTSGFGERKRDFHQGIDIAARQGTPIVAAAAGTVIFSGVMRGYGNVLMIEHNPQILTVYAHNRKNLVEYGRKVKKGEKVAEVGRTGRATGNHLHFEVRVNGEPVDPKRYLP